MTSDFLLSSPGEPFILKRGVWQPARCGFELREVTDDESSTTSPATADRQLRPPQSSTPSADELGLLAKAEKTVTLFLQHFPTQWSVMENNNF